MFLKKNIKLEILLPAFDNNTKTNCKDWLKYIFNIIRCILCSCTQLVGIVITKKFCIKVIKTTNNVDIKTRYHCICGIIN